MPRVHRCPPSETSMLGCVLIFAALAWFVLLAGIIVKGCA